jgi:hypothetical protein
MTTPQPLGSRGGSQAINSAWRTLHTGNLKTTRWPGVSKRPSLPGPLIPSSTTVEVFITNFYIHMTTSSNHPSATHALHLHATPTHLALLQTLPTQGPKAAQLDPEAASYDSPLLSQPPLHPKHQANQMNPSAAQTFKMAPKKGPGHPRKVSYQACSPPARC